MNPKSHASAILLFLGCLFMTACRTNTALDALFYKSEELYAHVDTPERDALCSAIEAKGHEFDMFEVSRYSVKVIYPPHGEQKEYTRFIWVGGRALTSIHRDFDSADPVSDMELERLQPEAVKLCYDMQRQASRFFSDNIIVGFVLHDWIVGVTIQYDTTSPDDCATIAPGSIAVGGYGDPFKYENLPSVCIQL
jgi:hypothetical protein